MSATEIIDLVLPLTREDNNCGFRKAKKLKARGEMVLLINDYREGKAVKLPDDMPPALMGAIESLKL
jgi:hypothetical protein